MSKIEQVPIGAWLGLGAALAGAWLLWKAAKAAPGLISGNNAITQSATNAAGQPTTAYQGAGIVGTLGAATNAASGGVLASVGEWLGSTVYDWTHTSTSSDEPQQGSAGTQPSGWDYTGKNQTFDEASQPGGWWPWGVGP